MALGVRCDSKERGKNQAFSDHGTGPKAESSYLTPDSFFKVHI